jgi:hypothetical protein
MVSNEKPPMDITNLSTNIGSGLITTTIISISSTLRRPVHTEEKNNNQQSLKIMLMGIPHVKRFKYNYGNKRVNVSVMAKNFSDVSKAISTMLSTAGFPSQPIVKQNYNPTGSLGSKKTRTSKYLDTFSKYKKLQSPTSLIATSAGNQSHTTVRSTPTWNTNRIPTKIDFSADNIPTISHSKTKSPITIASEWPTPVMTTNYLDAATGTGQLQGSNSGQYGSSFQPVLRK